MPEKITSCEFCDTDGHMTVIARNGEILVPCPFCGAGTRLLHNTSKASSVPMPKMSWEYLTRGFSGASLHVIGLSISLYSMALAFGGTMRKNMIIHSCADEPLAALLSALANEHIRRGRAVLYGTSDSLWHEVDYLLNVPILIVGEINADEPEPYINRLGAILKERLQSDRMTIIGSTVSAQAMSAKLEPLVGAPLETYATMHDASDFSNHYGAR